ncbi:MAG: hypothetical protein WC959_07305 [Kiritimatiellales bacterium]
MSQIRTRERVAHHGEVFTSEREVNAMLDLVKPETERIESRFLEPACGNGNFLAQILRRKLAAVERRYRTSQPEYERYAVLAIASLYGIELLADNVSECRERLFEIFYAQYGGIFRDLIKEECCAAVRYILRRNILWGDALTLQYADGSGRPIVFSEWSPVNGSMLKRRDFTFHGLFEHQSIKVMPLFSDLGDDVFIPEPVQDFPPVHFMKIAEGFSDE